SPPAENQVKTINATAARSPGAPRLIVTATTPTNRWSTTNAGIDEALAALARDAIALATSAAASRVRSCAAGDCIRLFLPERSTRTWCSTACGNRVRAARHYAHRTP
ncbi:CGNR zinc finger domain-containing protein, partial [Agreia sp.]|uniref:CGNR zinc finger domain-containing protein n=1 Tax=Agreia sp. TaxID=1872416 RepID=UPI0035BC5DA3